MNHFIDFENYFKDLRTTEEPYTLKSYSFTSVQTVQVFTTDPEEPLLLSQ